MHGEEHRHRYCSAPFKASFPESGTCRDVAIDDILRLEIWMEGCAVRLDARG